MPDRISLSQSVQYHRVSERHLEKDHYLLSRRNGISMWFFDCNVFGRMRTVKFRCDATSELIMIMHLSGIRLKGTIDEFNFPTVWRVDVTEIARRYQGFGIAAKMYRWYMMCSESTLVAGKAQSPGGRKIWYDLCRMKNVDVLVNIDGQWYDAEADEEASEVYVEGHSVYDGEDASIVARIPLRTPARTHKRAA